MVKRCVALRMAGMNFKIRSGSGSLGWKFPSAGFSALPRSVPENAFCQMCVTNISCGKPQNGAAVMS